MHIHTHLHALHVYIYKKYFSPFSDLNISKDQNQKSMRTRKCTGFISISTVSPAFPSHVTWPNYKYWGPFVCFTEVFSSSRSLLMASPSVPVQLAGECPWKNGHIKQESQEFNGHHNSPRCDFVSTGAANFWPLICLTLFLERNRF